MLSTKSAYEALKELPGISEKDHFGSDAFYANKRIFATVWHESKEVNVRLSPALQKEYVGKAPEAFEQIQNAWGKQGWTTIKLGAVSKKEFNAAITAAFEHSAKPTATKKVGKTGARKKAKKIASTKSKTS